MKFQPIDSAAAKEDALLIYGKNFLLKITEDKNAEMMAEKTSVRHVLEIDNLYTNEKKEAVYKLKKLDDRLHLLFNPESFAEVGLISGFDAVVPIGEYIQNYIDAVSHTRMSEYLTSADYLRASLKIGRTKASEKKGKESNRDDRKKEEELLESIKKRAILGSTQNVKRLLQETDEEMKKLSQEIVGTGGMSLLLNPTNLFLCPECDVFLLRHRDAPKSSASKKVAHPKQRLQVGEFLDEASCPSCDKQYNRLNAKRYPIHTVKMEISELLSGDRWFEMYMARQMRLLGWDKVWTRCMVMGATGSIHEIDVLALKEDRLATIECKTGSVKREDIFTYWTKASDIRSQFNIFASILTLPDSDTRRFAKSYPGFLCLESMGDMSYEQLKAKMTSYLGIAGA